MDSRAKPVPQSLEPAELTFINVIENKTIDPIAAHSDNSNINVKSWSIILSSQSLT